MDPFVIRWLLSIVVGAAWVAAATTIAERVSGKLGGLIIGLPAIPVVSLLFIGLTQSVGSAQQAAIALLFSTGLYSFFYMSYLIFSKKSFWTGLLGSLLVWFFFAAFAGKFHPTDISSAVILWLALIVVCIPWTVKNISIDMEKIPQVITKTPLWLKAGLSGLIIGIIVLLSKVIGPMWGGIFATFPGLTVPTLLITVKSGGVEFTRMITKNIFVSAVTTLGIFAILNYFLMPVFGIILGVIVSYAGLWLIGLPLYFLVFEKIKD